MWNISKVNALNSWEKDSAKQPKDYNHSRTSQWNGLAWLAANGFALAFVSWGAASASCG